MPGRDDRGGSGISVSTLIIASVASVAATFVVSRVWGPGTIIGAAATPVIVAVVSEALRHPAERLPPIPGVALPPRQEARRPPPAPGGDGPDEFAGPRKDFRSGRRNRWRVAVVTGLAAFALVVGAFTLVDLVAGKPVTGGGHSTFFDPGGRRHRDSAQSTSPTGTATTVTVTTATTTTTTPTVTTTTPATGATQPTTTAPGAATTPAPTAAPPPATGGAPTTP
jgi:hypothetical protein